MSKDVVRVVHKLI